MQDLCAKNTQILIHLSVFTVLSHLCFCNFADVLPEYEALS